MMVQGAGGEAGECGNAPSPGATEIACNPWATSLGPSPHEQYMALCLSGIKIRKLLPWTWSDGLLLMGEEP